MNTLLEKVLAAKGKALVIMLIRYHHQQQRETISAIQDSS